MIYKIFEKKREEKKEMKRFLELFALILAVLLAASVGITALVSLRSSSKTTVVEKKEEPKQSSEPIVYRNVSGEFVRDDRYDGVNQDVNLSSYLAQGYGRYYGVYKLGFSDVVLLDSLTLYNRNSDYHLNGAFDVFYSSDGIVWTKKAEYLNMTDPSSWDGSETIDDASCYYLTINMNGVKAQYVAIGISVPTNSKQCALWYAEATGFNYPILDDVSEPIELHFSTVDFIGYKGWMDADQDGLDRYNQRSSELPVQEGNRAFVICDSDKGGTVAFKALSYSVAAYYPEIYLKGDCFLRVGDTVLTESQLIDLLSLLNTP